MRGGVRAAAGLVMAALLAGCGGGANKGVQSVAEESALRPIPLIGTTWLLTSVTQMTGTLAARPNVDSTLLVQPNGQYLLRSCNNVFGTVTTADSTAEFAGGSDTWRHCAGVADQVDQAVAAVLPGHVEWAIDGRTLRVTNPATSVELSFRPRDGAPPLNTVPVAVVIDGRVRCKLVAGHTRVGDRLYALSRMRAGGPWRLLPTGPAAPGEGPLLAPQFTDTHTGQACVAGFAPHGTTNVRYVQPDGVTDNLRLYHPSGVDDAVYVGVIPTQARLIARDASGRALADWSATS